MISGKFPRRDFLIGCGQAAAGAFIPASHGWLATAGESATGSDLAFHLHPHYREQRPLDAVLEKRSASADDLITERYHDEIALTLAKWTESLLGAPRDMRPVATVLAADFQGCSLEPAQSKVLRPGGIAVRQLSFAESLTLRAEAFTRELEVYLTDLTELFTADLHITRIDVQASDRLLTQVRYELVGTGNGFYREQRVGTWELEWQRLAPAQYQVRCWRVGNETRSRSRSPMYEDHTEYAFGSNPSYAAQLAHGVDYWRTVLDGACGIDIYGHNGVSAGDIDGNGFEDVYVCQPAGLPNRLYRNRGDGTFEDITNTSGVGVLDNTACALFADFNNDGLQDLVVVCANGPLLFLNQGNSKFRQKPDAFRFATTPQGTFTGAAAADYDRDGWLDIYFCLYVYYQGTDQYKYPTPYYDANDGPPNFLMRNNRDGTFRDATAESGLNQNNTRYSFCCGWTDVNNDGWPDLYVVNDFGRKNLYRNNGNGTFTDVASQAGVGDVGAGMSVCCFDYDNDGAQDLYVADMWTAAGERISTQDAFKGTSSSAVRALYQKHAMGNSLFRNDGSGVFSDRTQAAGVGMGRWSWSSDAWDFDHDGYPDLYVANGMLSGPLRDDLNSFFWRQVVANSPDVAKPSHVYEQGWNAINELIRADYSWSGYERNVFYGNNRDGTFSDVSGTLGLDFREDGRAFALADFDHDGRLEVLLKNRNAPQIRLLKNVVEGLPLSISFRLRGTKSNRDAIGAVVTIKTSAGQQTRMLQAGSGFLSQHSKEVLFGLGEAKGDISATIRWPSGLMQQLKGLPPNHRVWVIEGSEPSRLEAFKPRVRTTSASVHSASDSLPDKTETWLLVPVSAPDFPLPNGNGRTWNLSSLRGKPLLLTISDERPQGVAPPFLAVPTSGDIAATYNLLFRYLFDRHHDLLIPTSFLIDERGQIVKIYQGPVHPKTVEKDFRNIPRTDADRLARALPFAGVSTTFEFGRNYLSLGSIFFQRGYIESAGEFFQSALKANPSSAEAFYGAGSVYLKQEKNSQARECFERAAKLNSAYPETAPNAWNNLGLLATREGQMAQAMKYFEQALQLDPEHVVALDNLGNAYRHQKRWDEARRTFERALAIEPVDPEANYNLGLIFAQANDTARAYEYLQKALQARPDYPPALNNLGVLCLRTDRRDEAVAAFKKCIHAAPAFDQSYLNLAKVYVIEGNPGKARTILLALLKQHPDHVLAQQALTQLH